MLVFLEGRMCGPPAWANQPLRFFFVRFLLYCFVVFLYHLAAQGLEPSAESHKALTIKPCAKIAASDPKFAPLADACEYALSPNNLPSFVCDESVQQFTSASGPENWQKLADVTAIVTFDHKKEERFSNLSRNGQPIRALSKPHHGQDVDLYFAYNLKSPAPQLSLFGTDLVWVFDA